MCMQTSVARPAESHLLYSLQSTAGWLEGRSCALRVFGCGAAPRQHCEDEQPLAVLDLYMYIPPFNLTAACMCCTAWREHCLLGRPSTYAALRKVQHDLYPGLYLVHRHRKLMLYVTARASLVIGSSLALLLSITSECALPFMAAPAIGSTP
jgi:hypothetical protein